MEFLVGSLLELITQTSTNLPHNTLAIVSVLLPMNLAGVGSAFNKVWGVSRFVESI